MFRSLFKTDAPATTGTAAPAAAATPAPEPVVVSPAVDIRDDGNEVVILADLPGVAPSGLELTVDGPHLLLKASPSGSPTGTLRFADRHPHRVYERRFALSDTIDRNAITAHLGEGVARITLSRHQAVRTRRIPIA